MASSSQQMVTNIIDRSRTLINNDLKTILREEGLQVTGNKAALQSRIHTHVTSFASRGDMIALQRMLHRVQNNGNAPRQPHATSSTSPAVPSFSSHQTPASTNGYTMANGYNNNNNVSYPSFHPAQPSRPTYFFKESPFFEVRESIMTNITLDASPSHRQNCTRTLILNDGVCSRLKSDSSLRLLLFGALDQPLAPFTRLDIQFPSQIEVRVNGEEVKANYKGLKNKPGSTRPADLTDLVRTTPANHRNNFIVTYALTQKVGEPPQKYSLSIYMVKKFSIEQLTQRIGQRNVITRQSVLSEMMAKANDPDIEVGSSVMSLKDPVSTVRIKTPCRSTVCTHNQCFDAVSFLQLQEQAPTWTCPICSKTVSYESLAVDKYVEEILSKVRNADQVTIKPNGEWSLEKEATPPRNNGYSARDDSDDDIVELSDYRDRLSIIKSEAAPTPVSLSTPPLPSRETSTAPRSGNKRPSEVVDLTLSDDDEPPRPAKKVAYHHTPSSFSEPMLRFQLPPIPNSTDSAAHSRPLPLSYNSSYSNPRSEYPRPPTTPPERSGYASYRHPPPPPPISRPSYPGQGTSQYPSYLGSSSP